MPHTLSYLDLFAGAGGLSEGFIRSGFRPIAHVEMDEAACYTLKTRAAYHYLKKGNHYNTYLKYLKGEITRNELYNKVPKKELAGVINMALSTESNETIFKQIDSLLKSKDVDLIIGGPPCQAYSLVGRARSRTGMTNDPRNYLYLQYAKYLRRYNPKLFVFENVVGLRSAGGGSYFEKMKEEFSKAGYDIKTFLFNARDFGVLQGRKRIILIGYRRSFSFQSPEFKHFSNSKYKVKCVFEDLPKLHAGEGNDKYSTYKKAPNKYLLQSNIRNGLEVLTQHISRPHTTQDKEIYRIAIEQLRQGNRLNYVNLPKRLKTHSNQHSFFDRFKVVDGSSHFAQTIVAHIAKDGHYYIHPDLNQNRSITVREAARLQSFPDDFYFEGVREGKNRTAAFKQIGNAVPPLMAESIAKALKEIL
ncbi:MAG: DNA (cytosine-5-)-methyltransferase [Cyclobacteriaceae bacterium]|nr:DNA (cytosine-5-)-methyltransferase [Cyclobacteriaceae bacterium]